MVHLELSRPMRVLVEEISNVRSDDDVVILTDDTRYPMAKALASAARAVDATTGILSLPMETRGGVELPKMAGAVMKSADYVFIMTSNNVTHTDAHRDAQAAGTQIASMWGANEDLFINGPSPENYQAVDDMVSSVKETLQGVSEIRITTDSGTDLRFSVEERPVIALGIKVNDKSDGAADFPQGEVAIAPVEGTATGRIRIDAAMDNIGLVNTPIDLTFEDGYLTKIEGGEEANQLRRMVEDSDDNAGNLAEFAIGTNEGARLVDNMRETKKKYGTIHIAIGDSNTIGGKVKSDLHLDGVVLDPTVFADGEKIMDSGELL
ncbi:aminopeptidase [Halorubrum sp. DTA98]|uniref:aminopeptidase n=1 Tax=Halorubrum sp. DTA98 TaxID=3402163 RepID=UPI003AAE2D7D